MKTVGLLLDASSPRQFATLVAGGEVVSNRVFGTDREMIAEVDLLLTAAKLDPSALSYVGVGVGPGSYTGLRVAQATAQGIALGLQIPLVPLLPLTAYHTNEPFAVLLDARIAGVYLWRPGMSEPESCALDDLEQRVPLGTTILSPCAEPLTRRLDNRQIVQRDPDPEILAAQASKAFESGQGTTATLPLLYLRKTEAELTKPLN